MFRPREENTPPCGQYNTECIELAEKTRMWTQKLEHDPSIENDTGCEGVENEVDEPLELTALPVYNKILENTAYDSFTTSLKKEFTLQMPANQPLAMIESVRRKILNRLPPAIINKLKAPSAYAMKFDLHWCVEMERSLQREFERPTESAQWLLHGITVTGSPAEAQALTIEQYLRQTWPVNGQGLLNVLRKTIDSPSRCSSGIDIPPTRSSVRGASPSNSHFCRRHTN